MSQYTKGDGVFKIRGDKIYVHGTVNGKFYRKSTGKKVTPATKAWIKKADPLKVLADLIGEITTETNIDLESFGKSVLESTTKNISIKHRKEVFSVFKKHILKNFNGISLENIKPIDLIGFIEKLKEQYSYTRVKFIKNTFSCILDHAADNHIIESNPFYAKTVQKVNLKWIAKSKEYTTEEVEKILGNATSWLKVFLNLAFKTGLRTSEIMALKWNDFDLENNALYLQRTINNDRLIVEYGENDNQKIKAKNKNHYRTVILFDSTVELLKKYYEFRIHKEWLFVNKDSKPFLYSQSIICYHFKPLLEELGIKYKTLYATRKTYTSIMNFSNSNFEDLQKNLGHAKGSEVTSKHYISDKILTDANRKTIAKNQEKLFNTLVSNVQSEN